MSAALRGEQACCEDGCSRPARHGELCAGHYRCASAPVRALCDLLDRISTDIARALALEAPCVEPDRRAA